MEGTGLLNVNRGGAARACSGHCGARGCRYSDSMKFVYGRY